MAELRLNLDPSGVESGSNRAENALRGVAGAATRTDDALNDVSRRAMPQAARASGGLRNQARLLSQQLSQVGQQTQATGNFVQALAIQLPDIGLAFGTIGTAVGLLAGIALPSLINMFRGAGADADALSDQMDNLEAATAGLNDALRLQAGDAEDLAAAYGLVIEQARALNAIGIAAGFRAQRDALKGVIDEATSGSTGVKSFDLAVEALSQSLGESAGNSQAALRFFNELSAETSSAVVAFRALGVAADDANVTTDELRKQTADLIETLNEMDSVGFSGLIGNLLDIVTGLAGVEAAAGGAVAALREVAAQSDAADRIVNNPDFFDPRNEAGTAGRVGRDRRNPQGRTSRSGRTGGGAASQVDKLATEFEQLRGQIDPTWRALQQYTDAVEVLDRALAGGLIKSQAEYDELLAQTATRFTEMGQLAQSVGKTIEDAMTTAFIGLVDGTLDAEEAFKQMATSIIAELFRVLVVQQLVGSFSAGGGGLLGGVFSLFGGARAEGGPVERGIPYLVGERGPELFVPSGSGQIQANGAGSGVTIVQNNTFQSGVTRQEVASMLPALAESAKSAVRDDMQRRPAQWGR